MYLDTPNVEIAHWREEQLVDEPRLATMAKLKSALACFGDLVLVLLFGYQGICEKSLGARSFRQYHKFN
jgi:hypothetical protein